MFKKMLASFVKAIVNKALEVIGNAITGEADGRAKQSNKIVGVVAVLVLLFLVLFEVVYFVMGTFSVSNILSTIGNGSGLEGEEVTLNISDAASLAEYLRETEDVVFTEENSFLVDEKTLLQVLDAVAEYNAEMSLSKEVTYQYLKDYKLEAVVDGITGELKKPEKKEKVETEKEQIAKEDNTEQVEDTSKGEFDLGKVFGVSFGEDTITLSTKSIDNAPAETGEDIFYMNWQPIVVLACMYIQDNYENIGTYEEEGIYGKSYYLSESELSEVIQLLAFEYTYYRDYCHSDSDYISFNYITKQTSGYRLDIQIAGEGKDKCRIIRRIPAIAPKRIQNTYLSYEYVYEPLENGYYFLKERTSVVDGNKLVSACKELIPSFDPDVFLELLALLPETDNLVAHYREDVFGRAARGEIYTNTVSDVSICPSIGVIVSDPEKGFFGGLFDDGNGLGSMEWNGECHIVPLYGIDGWGGRYIRPGEWLVAEGNSYGNFEVYEDAMRSLTASDGFSVDELVSLFQSGNFSSKSPLFADSQAVRDTAQCFYDYQESTGTSVCGLLAIMRQEGGFTSAIARNGWNYFNIKASSGQATTSYTKADGTVVNTDFRNYRAIYEKNGGSEYKTPAVNALSAQMNWINNNYWSKGQNSYYLMVWNGYNISDPAHAYETIRHSYCPPWDDQAMPYSQDSYILNSSGGKVQYWKNANAGYRGWINNCALFRYQYYTSVKGTE